LKGQEKSEQRLKELKEGQEKSEQRLRGTKGNKFKLSEIPGKAKARVS
jgi:hypothetical protein